VTPSLRSSIRLAASAFRREAWLAALGLLVTGARRVTSWPALWAAWTLLWRAVISGALRHPGSLAGPIEGALAMATSARFIGIVGGLWLAGALLSAALRLAWISGAVPTLGAAMSGAAESGAAPRGTAAFAEGLVAGFARVLPAAILGFVLELSGALFAGTLYLAATLLLVHDGGSGAGGFVGLAAATAGALVLALAVPLGLSTASDALVARAALLRERPAAALAAVTRRFVSRPGSFLLGAILFGVVGVALQLGVRAFAGVATGFALEAPALLRLGPELMVGVLAALVAGVLDLVWLGTLAVLSCGEARPSTRSG
jgi:hypothetical protein